MRVTLIHNPGAGRQDHDAKALLKLLRRAGHKPRYQSADEKGWDRVLDKRADLVAVAGGDGTVAGVTRRMVGRDVPVAILPSGTANNIARSLGLLKKPFEELVRGWPEARRVRLDVGIASGPWGQRYFVEGLGAGLFAGMLVRSEQNQGLELICHRLVPRSFCSSVENVGERLEPMLLAVGLVVAAVAAVAVRRRVFVAVVVAARRAVPVMPVVRQIHEHPWHLFGGGLDFLEAKHVRPLRTHELNDLRIPRANAVHVPGHESHRCAACHGAP